METKIKYISFCGDLVCPLEEEKLDRKCPYEDNWNQRGFRKFINYEKVAVGCDGALDIWVGHIDQQLGHLVVVCSSGGWTEDTFCFIGNNSLPIKASDFNPNPIEQAF